MSYQDIAQYEARRGVGTAFDQLRNERMISDRRAERIAALVEQLATANQAWEDLTTVNESNIEKYATLKAELAEARVTDDEIMAQSLTFAQSSWFRVTTTTMAYIEGAKWARGFVRVTNNADGRKA